MRSNALAQAGCFSPSPPNYSKTYITNCISLYRFWLSRGWKEIGSLQIRAFSLRNIATESFYDPEDWSWLWAWVVGNSSLGWGKARDVIQRYSHPIAKGRLLYQIKKQLVDFA